MQATLLRNIAGNPRTMTDAEVTAKLRSIAEQYETAKEGINRYIAES